ncbi:MAG TPA: hypothetical protein VMX55_04885 [candidate division Zixibacteria bacterium]|nr:hypothetical protein [candidate division Zixibacteria bacterium]
MRCKVIKVTLNVGLTNYILVEDTINIWLKKNPTVKIKNITQAGLGTKTIITTILYED